MTDLKFISLVLLSLVFLFFIFRVAYLKLDKYFFKLWTKKEFKKHQCYDCVFKIDYPINHENYFCKKTKVNHSKVKGNLKYISYKCRYKKLKTTNKKHHD